MLPIISLLVVLIVSMVVVRIASVALALTGLSSELARFQARSAFTGAGFTTSESEKVVHHPVRRRIIMLLMLFGNAGIVTAISSLVLTLVGNTESDALTNQTWFRVTILILGLAILWTVASSRWIDRQMSKLIKIALQRWTDLEVRDYAGLLHLSHGYVVSELSVEGQDWLAGRTLIELKLSDEGVLVLGIDKSDGTYFGAPRGQTVIEEGDVLYLYGRQETLANLDQRRRGADGNWEHHKAVSQQSEIEQEELKQQEERQAET